MPVDVAPYAPRGDLKIVQKTVASVNKTCLYVDGFNLYHAIRALDIPHLKWVNLRKLGESMLRGGEALTDVYYFTSEMTWEAQKLKRHRQYLAALKTVGVTNVLSKFLRVRKYCSQNSDGCVFHEEKQTDVALAVRLMTDCLTNGVTRAFLLTADSDQVPTVAALRGLCPNLEIVLVVPPGRFEISRELRAVAHRFVELTAGKLERSIFDRNVLDSRGKVAAICPAKYQHPRA